MAKRNLQLRFALLAGLALSTSLSTGFLGFAAQRPTTVSAPTSRPMITSATPRTTQDLELLESQIVNATVKVMPSVVSLLIDGTTQGSGVIVSSDGLILTAGHVTYDAGKSLRVILYNGRVYNAVTLGVNRTSDAAMVKITNAGNQTFKAVDLAAEVSPASNQWCIALGHSGGYQPGRSAPLRLGRVLAVRGESIFSTCILVSGDSGGPLFDLSGKLIGIHSRIGLDSSNNLHVSTSAFRDNWERLLKSEAWGAPLQSIGCPIIDAPMSDKDGKVIVGQLPESNPLFRSGLRTGDHIAKLNDSSVSDLDSLLIILGRLKPGDIVNVETLRGENTVKLKLPVSARE